MRFPARISRSLSSLRPGGRAAQEPMLVAGTSQLLADTVAKLPKSRATNFPQIDQTSRKSPTDVSSRPLPKSPVSSSQDNVVPQIIIRSPHVRPGKFVLVDAKRVLQQYRHKADLVLTGKNVRCWGEERTSTPELRTWRRMRNFELFFVHVCRHIGEKRRAQIAFAGVGKHAKNVCPFLGLGGNLERTSESPAGGNADKDALLGGKVLAVANSVRAGDRNDAIDDLHCDGIIGKFGDEIRRPPLHGVW